MASLSSRQSQAYTKTLQAFNDEFSYNLKVSVVEVCVFDRGQASHKINLVDLAKKFTDVS